MWLRQTSGVYPWLTGTRIFRNGYQNGDRWHKLHVIMISRCGLISNILHDRDEKQKKAVNIFLSFTGNLNSLSLSLSVKQHFNCAQRYVVVNNHKQPSILQ